MKSALCMKRAQSKIFDCSVFMKQEANMRKILKLFMTFVFACCLFVGVNPAEAGLISREQEIEMGQQTA